MINIFPRSLKIGSTYIGEEVVGQQGWNEGTGICNLASVHGAVEDMVLQDSSKEAWVCGQASKSRVVNLCESCVRRSKNGDVLGTSKGSNQIRAQGENTTQLRKA